MPLRQYIKCTMLLCQEAKWMPLLQEAKWTMQRVTSTRSLATRPHLSSPGQVHTLQLRKGRQKLRSFTPTAVLPRLPTFYNKDQQFWRLLDRVSTTLSIHLPPCTLSTGDRTNATWASWWMKSQSSPTACGETRRCAWDTPSEDQLRMPTPHNHQIWSSSQGPIQVPIHSVMGAM